MKFILIVALAVLATATGYCLQGQKLEACAKQIIKQTETDVNPICHFTFDTLRALLVQALQTNTLIDPEPTIQIATDRLYAVVLAAAGALEAILGTDANMVKLYAKLLEDVLKIIRVNIEWVNKILSDPNIILSPSVKLQLLDQSIADAQINGHNLNLHLQVALGGYINGAISSAVIKISDNTLIKPICYATFDGLRALSDVAFATRTPLSAVATIATASADLAAVVEASAILISRILVNDIPYTDAYVKLLKDVIALINQTVAKINAEIRNPLSSFSRQDARDLITKCQDDSHALYEKVIAQVPGFLFSSLAGNL